MELWPPKQNCSFSFCTVFVVACTHAKDLVCCLLCVAIINGSRRILFDTGALEKGLIQCIELYFIYYKSLFLVCLREVHTKIHSNNNDHSLQSIKQQLKNFRDKSNSRR